MAGHRVMEQRVAQAQLHERTPDRIMAKASNSGQR